MTDRGWTPRTDGFVNGDVGVFPALFGAWEVWHKIDGEWRAVKPQIYAARNGREHDPNASPPFRYWERTRDETIAEAKLLALEWRARRCQPLEG